MDTNEDMRNEVYVKLRDLEGDELNDFIDRVSEEIAFSTQNKGGVSFEANVRWCIIKIDLYGQSTHEFHDTKEEAIAHLIKHHCNPEYELPPYEELSAEMQGLICFEAPDGFTPTGKEKSDLNLLTSDEQKKLITSEIRQAVKDGVLALKKGKYDVKLQNHPTLHQLQRAHETPIEQQISQIIHNIVPAIEDQMMFKLKKKHGLTPPKRNSKGKWVKIENEESSFFLNSIRRVLNNKPVETIAEVLASSHSILEKEHLPENERGKRKPVNTNSVHRVSTESEVNDVISMMALKGFDNQPIYCNTSKRCVATIRLKEALKNLYQNKYSGFQTFDDYKTMIEENLLLTPPPIFLPTDPMDYVVSLFNVGCEAILFEFDNQEWEKYGGSSGVSAKLEDGWHIMTPHDIVVFLTEKGQHKT